MPGGARQRMALRKAGMEPGNIDYVNRPDLCTACPAGTSSFEGGLCVRCKEGQISKSGGFCIPCPPGMQPDAAQDACVPCPAGYFSNNGEMCRPCLVGYITTGPGAQVCLPCPAGRTSDVTHTNCVACSAGFSSVQGGSCTQCLPGSTARSGGLCEPCPEGLGDTTTVLGQCSPCPPGWSSYFGGVCTKCPAGTDSYPGGRCRPCQPGHSSVEGGLCMPCTAGYSAFAGGSCFPCPAGTFSSAGGNCTNCPSSFSSLQGSSGCSPCRTGETSFSGGLCLARCPDGFAWSNIFFQCVECPSGTHSVAGDISCTRCPFGWFSPRSSATCFPDDRIGGIARLDVPLSEFVQDDFQRSVANMLDTEVHNIEVYLTVSGSTVVYFSILDPTADELTPDASDLRRLGGNEKLLLLYQWWVMQTGRIDDLMSPLLDLKLFANVPSNSTTSTNGGQVVPLFAPSSNPSFIIPPQPVLKSSAFTNIPGFKASQTTLAIAVTIAPASYVHASLMATLLALLFHVVVRHLLLTRV